MFIFNLLAKHSAIIISGTYTSIAKLNLLLSTEGDSFRDIENLGMKGSDSKDAFTEMQKFASFFPGSV